MPDQNKTNMSILSQAELNVLESNYIDAFDDALAILEKAQQINPDNVFDNPNSR